MDARIWMFLFGLLFTTGFANAAGIYRWTDDKGVVHFTDSPPAAGDAPILDSDAYSPARKPGIRSGEKALHRQALAREAQARKAKAAANQTWLKAREKRAAECRSTDRALDRLRRSSSEIRDQEQRLLKRRRALRCMGPR
ncbi:MAG: DUF4124 domain-containing protein [Chromatiales bacterium]|nr:DUF4124 domain-containing protein [Chromatiales bacterium]